MASLNDLRKHFRRHGVVVIRDKGPHTVYLNPANGKTAAVPRHIEIAKGTANKICDQLEIPRPTGI
jgi:mRNA interferase HicA